ncbi:MAG TPA: BatD family protein [Gemmatimonadaceae bacterium]|nr:BatD family protein [Gemmatimonadaceae bacterium]
MLSALAVAAQLAIVAHAPDSVAACEPIEVSVAVSARGAVIPRLVAPSLAPFDVLRAGTSPHLEYGGARTIAEYRFTLATDRIGHYTIPPFEARVGDERVLSRPTTVVVRPLRGRSAPAVIARARIDTSSDVNLGGAAAADTVYVGQQATYEVAVFLNQTVRDRLKRNPTFYPPEMQAMLAYDLSAPAVAPKKRTGSQCFDALVYRRALFPLVAGRLVIPPAQLVYSTGMTPLSLLRSEETHELQTDSVTIVAIDPPLAGRPAEYDGAVGAVRVDARVDSAASRVGDPMLLTVSVTGTGNVKLFPRPDVKITWAALVAADERVRIDSINPRVGGVKEFDWVLTPRVAGEFDVPPVRYGYFNPSQRRYDVATAPERRIRVGPGALASADTGNAEAALTIRTSYGGPSWPPLQSRPEFWLLLALAPLPAIAAGLRRRTTQPARVVPYDPMRSLSNVSLDDAVALRRHFVRALAHRLGCNPEDFTHPGALARAVRRAGVSPETASRAESLLRDLDSAAYAGVGNVPPTTLRDATNVVRAVDSEALARSELPFWVPVVVMALALGLAANALASDAAAVEFARGVSAYVRQDYVDARHAFADAVATAPRSADAWANYGTASWSVSPPDTAAAIYGWRQALALQPGADDLHERVGALREDGVLSPGWVPEVPRNTGVVLFALLWLAAWACAWIAARRDARFGSWPARLTWPMVAVALVVGLVSVELETRIAGGRLAVVRHVSSLTSEPAIGMDRGPIVGTGEIVRLAGRNGAWARVEAANGRDGWIPTSQLLLLADRRAPRD